MLLFGAVYSVPNLFKQSPALQVSSGKATVKVEAPMVEQVVKILADAQVPTEAVYFDHTQSGGTVRVRFHDTDTQTKGRDALQHVLAPNPDEASYVVALNSVSDTPLWLQHIGALPMYLGLDLRGGVHFLMQIDMQAALNKRIDSVQSDLRAQLREKNIRHAGITRQGNAVEIAFRDDDTRNKASAFLQDQYPDLAATTAGTAPDLKLVVTLTPKAEKQAMENAVKQNVSTLHNRVNELGVAEPVVQQQGADRIVVQLPGVQDVAQAKKILGRTATLEFRAVDDGPEAQAALAAGTVPFGDERYVERGSRPLLVKREVILTGENLQDAQPGFDSQKQVPSVNLVVDGKGATILKNYTRDNVGKRMAVLLVEKGQGRSHHRARDPKRTRHAFPDFGLDDLARGQRPRALAARRRAGRADGNHRRTHDRPEPGRRQHRQGLPFGALGLRCDPRLHDDLLHDVRPDLGRRAGHECDAAGGVAFIDAGHPDLARHRGHRARTRDGHRLERADQRAHPRRIAARACRPSKRSRPAMSALGQRFSTRT